ncbi:MAG TPA: glycosyltransferase family 39 protein, partial [Blastocatellia bacterium]|nr:glycosyltransferase family 39 protein [Blastocatellia bacterium]
GASLAVESVFESSEATRFNPILLAAFAVASASAAVAFIFMALKNPHGEWDAWAVYNMKARFFFRAGDNWRDLFSEPMRWTSTDYPLLIPASIAGLWTLIGTETLVIPSAVAMIFTLATAGLLSSSISALRSKNQGLLAGLILLCTPYFLIHGADLYCDIPVGFFFLATIALFSLQTRMPDGDHRFLILAGITAGLAAWTKNEGLMFLVAVVVARFLTLVPRNGIRPYLRQMLYFGAGALPSLALILYLKLAFAQSSLLLAQPAGRKLSDVLLDPARYRLIAESFFKESYGFGSWAISIVPFLLLYMIIVGVKIEKREKASVATALIILSIMLFGFFMIYVISPRDLVWHINVSLNRLYTQMWPSFIFVFFMIARTPEACLASNKPAPASL